MNYEPNTTQWQKGDIVIHDADEKSPHMLMRVIGYTRTGLCKTQYVDKSRKRTVWVNEIRFLHDPKRFAKLKAGLVLMGLIDLPKAVLSVEQIRTQD